MFFDPLYFAFMIPTMLLSFWASYRVKSQFNKYAKVGTTTGMTGADAAAQVLRAGGVSDVRIEQVSGFLSDHYDPTKKVLRLSPDVYSGRSISAVGVGAHEAGHAIQHKNAYSMLTLRSLLVPTASIGSNMSWIILMIGFVLQATSLIYIGIALFSFVVLFQIVTLPVEFDASARAKRLLWDTGILTNQRERAGVGAVLDAAAWTYVAAAISAIATLIYFLIRSGLLGGSSND